MLFQETFFDGITKAWAWDELALIPYGEDLQTYLFPCCKYAIATACWYSPDPAGYPDDINSQFYAAVPTYSLDLLERWKMTVIGVASTPINAHYIPSDETTVNVAER